MDAGPPRRRGPLAGPRRIVRRLFDDTPVTTGVAAVAFTALAVVFAVVPVPYVAWSPGLTTDVLGPADSGTGQAVAVTGLPTYPTDGELRLTTVGVTRSDSRLTLPAALVSHWLPARAVLPRDAVYAPGTTREESASQSARMMDTAQQAAVVAGLRSAGVLVTEVPMVLGVTTGAPADGLLEPGDAILEVDGVPVGSPTQAIDLIRGHRVGDEVSFALRRDGERIEVAVPTRAAEDDPTRAVVGATVGVGYEHPGTVTFGIRPDIGGPSAGLAFALAINDKLTPGALTGGRIVAATGTIAADGAVGAIGGVQSKARGAEESGAELFLMPRSNCDEVASVRSDVRLVPVATLGEAIEALSDPTRPVDDLPRCP